MNNKKYHLSKLKKELELRKSKGNEYVIWNLSQEQREYLFNLGYNIIVELYCIKTEKLINPKNQNAILKDIHYANKKGKKYIVRKLKKDELKILERFNVVCYPIKYKIFL